MAAGDIVKAEPWERFWLELLAEYENTVDRLCREELERRDGRQ